MASKVGSSTGTTAGTLLAYAKTLSGTQYVANAGKTAWSHTGQIPLANLIGLVGSEATIVNTKDVLTQCGHQDNDDLAATNGCGKCIPTPKGLPVLAPGMEAEDGRRATW